MSEDFQKRLELMSTAELTKELARRDISPGYRSSLQKELNSRGGGSSAAGTGSLFDRAENVQRSTLNVQRPSQREGA